jgi:hypothetical protein
VHLTSLYIGRKGKAAVLVLVRLQLRILVLLHKLLFPRIRLGRPIPAGSPSSVASRPSCKVTGLGRGSLVVVMPIWNPIGPVSISPRAFHGCA